MSIYYIPAAEFDVQTFGLCCICDPLGAGRWVYSGRQPYCNRDFDDMFGVQQLARDSSQRELQRGMFVQSECLHT